MGTVNFTGFVQGSGTDPSYPTPGTIGSQMPFGLQKLGIKKVTVDTAKTGITNTNADVYEAIYLPAGTKVLDAWFYVTEAEATNTNATFQLGITGGTTDGFVAAATCAAIALHATNASTYTAAGGYTATSAETIDLLVATAAFTNCVVDVYALVVDLNP